MTLDSRGLPIAHSLHPLFKMFAMIKETGGLRAPGHHLWHGPVPDENE